MFVIKCNNHISFYRKLEKPISIQDDTKIQKYNDTYNVRRNVLYFSWRFQHNSFVIKFYCFVASIFKLSALIEIQ